MCPCQESEILPRRLPKVLAAATEAFLDECDRYVLADLVEVRGSPLPDRVAAP